MKVTINNKTDKALVVSCDNNDIKLEPFSSGQIEIDKPCDIEIYKNNSIKAFGQRFKEEFSLKELNPRHLQAGFLYSSYLKTVISLGSVNEKSIHLDIKETEYVNKRFLNIRCFSVDSKLTCIENINYKCIDKTHKRCMKMCADISILLQYGILAFIGVFFDLFLLADWDESMKEFGGDMVFLIIAALGFTAFIALFVIQSIWVRRIIKKL